MRSASPIFDEVVSSPERMRALFDFLRLREQIAVERSHAALPIIQSIHWLNESFIDAKPASGDKPRQPVSQSPRCGREWSAISAGGSGQSCECVSSHSETKCHG